jgi:hypothetical protein
MYTGVIYFYTYFKNKGYLLRYFYFLFKQGDLLHRRGAFLRFKNAKF